MSTWIARARVCDVHFRSGHARTSTHARDKAEGVGLVYGSSKLYRRFFILSVSLPASTGAGRTVSFPRVFRTSDLVYVSVWDTYLSRARTMKYRVSRFPTTVMCVVGVVLRMASTSPAEPLPSILLDGIGNVANSATNFRELIQMSISIYRKSESIECSTELEPIYEDSNWDKKIILLG